MVVRAVAVGFVDGGGNGLVAEELELGCQP